MNISWIKQFQMRPTLILFYLDPVSSNDPDMMFLSLSHTYCLFHVFLYVREILSIPNLQKLIENLLGEKETWTTANCASCYKYFNLLAHTLNWILSCHCRDNCCILFKLHTCKYIYVNKCVRRTCTAIHEVFFH